MSDLAILLMFLIYIGFYLVFAYRRGTRRELWVLIVSSLGWFLLQGVGGDILIRMVNLVPKFLAFVQAGGLGDDQEAAFSAVGSTAGWITEANRDEFLFITWLILVVLTYILTADLIKLNRSDGWTIVVGLINALFWAAIFLPVLAQYFIPELATTGVITAGSAFADLVRTMLDLIWGSLEAFWIAIEPIRQYVLLILLILLLVFAFSTLSGARAKPKS